MNYKAKKVYVNPLASQMANDTNAFYPAISKKNKRVLLQYCLYIFSFILCYENSNAQTTSITNGAVVTITSTTIVITTGDINIAAGGALNNSGNLQLQGNWTNNGAFNDNAGTVIFNAPVGSRTISGSLTGSNKFNNLSFNGGASAAWTFLNDAEVGGNLSLMRGVVSSPAGILTLKGNMTQTSGKFFHNNGMVLFKGSSLQSYTATTPLTFYDLTNNNNGGSTGLSINSDLVLEHELQLKPVSKLKLVSGDIILRSTALNTANVAAVPSEANIIQYGTGRFIVERYINTGTAAGQHGKSWQFLSAPAIGQTIAQSWMEGAGPNADPNHGFGTQITGPGGIANGFDVASNEPSMKYYVPVSNSWTGVDNPTTTGINNKQGYFLFVRGDRSVINFSGANSSPLPTTLRSRGNIQAGDVTSLPVTAGLFQSVGNPYPSAIDFSTISRSGGVDPNFYLWDPTLAGSRGLGGYQTITAATGYLATPGNLATTSTIYNTTTNYKTIQSGESFFVRATGADGILNFTESNKVSGSMLANRPAVFHPKISMLSTDLLSLNGTVATLVDGNRVVFNNSYSDRVNADDAIKITNASENFGLSRNGSMLAVEARKVARPADTIYYNMSGLRPGSYKLMFIPGNINSDDLSAELIDRYSNTRSPVDLKDTTQYNISIKADIASQAPGRFILVFKKNNNDDHPKAKSVLDNSSITVSPNPVTGKNLQVVFSNNPAGRYHLQLNNWAGQLIHNSFIDVSNKKFTRSITLDETTPTGIYQLNITGPDGKNTIIPIIIR